MGQFNSKQDSKMATSQELGSGERSLVKNSFQNGIRKSKLEMEMSSIVIDVEKNHGHHNRIVEAFHHGQNKIVEAFNHGHHGIAEAHHRGHHGTVETLNHQRSNSYRQIEPHHHHHHHHSHSHKIVPVSVTPPEFEIPDLWEGNEEEKEENEEKEEKEKKEEITLGERLGVEEIFSAKVWRSSMAELLGTAALAFMTDAITISASKVDTEARMLIPATIIPIIVAFLVLATIPVTGGHINPIVSMSFGLMGRIPLCRAVIYIMAQCTGAILGALALKAVVDEETERTFLLGGCTIANVGMGPEGPVGKGLGTTRAFYLEVICSFVFLFISRWMAFDAKKADMLSRLIYCFGIGIGVGFNAFVSRSVTGATGYSGVGVNPATCFGPAVVRGGRLWDRHWIFWIGPTIASICFYSYSRVIIVENVHHRENKHDFFNFLKACYRAIRHK